MDPMTNASSLLRLVLSHPRTLRDARGCKQTPCERCTAVHLPRVASFLARGEPLLFVLPGFPGKSPNRLKVLDCVPDKAEWLVLGFLQSLCDRIAEAYAPGARIVLCSDGRVFSDVLGIPDADITRYQLGLQRMLQERGARSLSLFNLAHELGAGTDFEAMRQRLMEGYGEPLEVLRAAVRRGGEAASLHRGLARTLFEDALGSENREGLAALRKRSRERAYGVLQRSKAWGALVATRFPGALRLSIHPQACGSGKLGLGFPGTADPWLTPWHGVAVEVTGRFILMPRHEAERRGCTLVHSEGRPSHFTAPDGFEPSHSSFLSSSL
jgi:pyoverdine/dityrosine biosynthesis protein Dit1